MTYCISLDINCSAHIHVVNIYLSLTKRGITITERGITIRGTGITITGRGFTRPEISTMFQMMNLSVIESGHPSFPVVSHIRDHAGTGEVPPRTIHLLNEDLPEVLMHKFEMKKRTGTSGIYTYHSNFSMSGISEQSSLLAPLRTHPDEAFLLNLSTDFLHGMFVTIIVVLIIVFTLKFYLWRRRHRKITAFTPNDDDDEQHVAMDTAMTEDLLSNCDDFCGRENDVNGPQVPLLLQEVTKL